MFFLNNSTSTKLTNSSRELDSFQTKPSVSNAIGNTTLVKISNGLYAKLESSNPSGSIKDRMAKHLLNLAEERNELKEGGTIIEATSGNTGIAFSMLAAERGYRMIAVMPKNMSEERKKMIRAFGGEIIEVGNNDFEGAVEHRDQLVQELSAFCPNQFENVDNIDCHYVTTGQEIIQQVRGLNLDQKISAFVAGTGSGGTLMGVRKALVEVYPDVEIVAVEPTESAVMSGKEPGEHMIQGIGDGFIPPVVDMNFVDKIETVSSQESIARMHRLTRELGLMVGISSGAHVLSAEKYIEKYQPDGIVVTILCDRQERYFSLIN